MLPRQVRARCNFGSVNHGSGAARLCHRPTVVPQGIPAPTAAIPTRPTASDPKLARQQRDNHRAKHDWVSDAELKKQRKKNAGKKSDAEIRAERERSENAALGLGQATNAEVSAEQDRVVAASYQRYMAQRATGASSEPFANVIVQASFPGLPGVGLGSESPVEAALPRLLHKWTLRKGTFFVTRAEAQAEFTKKISVELIGEQVLTGGTFGSPASSGVVKALGWTADAKGRVIDRQCHGGLLLKLCAEPAVQALGTKTGKQALRDALESKQPPELFKLGSTIL